ncbi:fungal-specific transcription factor domain-containing protein [Xylariales sp. PMI_506]|nr:fungal-specific transcription factor domain-containing protein [Xylariales sp. PMI_506]
MSSIPSPSQETREPAESGLACQPRACQFCRVRKIKCDKGQPSCSSCTAHGRTCIYRHEKPRPRPSAALVSSLRHEKNSLHSILLQLKTAKPSRAAEILDALDIIGGTIQIPEAIAKDDDATKIASRGQSLTPPPTTSGPEEEEGDAASDAGFDLSNHVSVDDQGQVGVFGLTSTLHDSAQGRFADRAQGISTIEESSYQLIANAALERQKEFRVRMLPDIDGVPVNIAMHLLDLHWNRQHHTFLLTYRPALMRDLVHGGPYCSKLLLNAIFACASKYSDRTYLRDDPADPLSAGGRFIRRCDELIATESPFGRPSIPTVVAFLLLGSTFVSRGDISKGWSYTGFAARMVYDLGLHIDCRKPRTSFEDVEIRRRVFWGCFICDKLQSLYLGRPMAMQLHDNHCPAEFADTFEELDLWTPYSDPELGQPPPSPIAPAPVYSVSTFQQLCHLSKLMTRIMNCFYSSNTAVSKAPAHLHELDTALSTWVQQLPAHLAFEPRAATSTPSPNVLNLHNTFHCLVILLNRPFVSDGHLRSQSIATARSCWKKCAAAARTITGAVSAYRTAYTLRGAPYLTSYAAYVSCTIHVRNAALEKGEPPGLGEHGRLLAMTLRALDEMSTPNPGVARPAEIIRRLMRKHGVVEPQVTQSPDPSPMDFSFMPELSPQSMTLTSLFDTFMPGGGGSVATAHDFEDLVGTRHRDSPTVATAASAGAANSDELWTNDSLFGFMNAMNGFPGDEVPGWNDIVTTG